MALEGPGEAREGRVPGAGGPDGLRGRPDRETGTRRLRVCVWAPALNLGGGVRFLAALVRALARHPDVGLLRLAVPPGAMSAALSRANLVEVAPLTVPAWEVRCPPPLSRERRILEIPGTGRLRQRWRQGTARWDEVTLRRVSADCDVVWCPWPHRQPYPRPGRPLITTVQDLIVFDFPETLGPTATREEWLRLRAWLDGSDALVLSSVASRDALIRHFGDRYDNAYLVQHAIVPAHDGSLALDGQAGSALPAPAGRYVLYPASYTPHKNHHNLFHAWARFSRRSQIRLVLLGPGTGDLAAPGPPWQIVDPNASRLAGTLARLRLSVGRDVEALGYLADADVHRLIAGAAALVMPSLAEGGGSFPVEEALAAGVPVLCSDIPVLREHLRGRTARIAWFDPDSPASIVAALEAVFADYDDYKARAVRGAGDPRPSWDDVAARYVDVFMATAGVRA
jgi:glycosyltransferase involved in cell wall biosynthesis